MEDSVKATPFHKVAP